METTLKDILGFDVGEMVMFSHSGDIGKVVSVDLVDASAFLDFASGSDRVFLRDLVPANSETSPVKSLNPVERFISERLVYISRKHTEAKGNREKEKILEAVFSELCNVKSYSESLRSSSGK